MTAAESLPENNRQPRYQSIPQLLEAHAERRPDAVAIAAPGREPLTYGHLLGHVDNVVRTLNAMGVGRNDRVAIVLPNGPDMAVAFVAVAAGATSAPLNPAYRASGFDFYLSDLGAKALIVLAGMDSPAIGVAQELGIPVIELSPMLGAGLFELTGDGCPPTDRGGFAHPDDVALVLHTSGTTSRPKLVPLTQKNICTSAHNIRTTLQLTDGDRCLNLMPLFHIHGLMGAALSSLTAGASIVCTPGFDAVSFFAWLDTFQPTWYTAVPTIHQAVLARAADNREIIALRPLRFIRSSSSSLPPQVMAALESTFGAPVIESYGMTEASHQMTSNPLPPGQRKAGSVGVAAGPEVAIMDNAGNRLPAGETGEIVIRGPSVTLGYENNPAANKGAFTHGWFRTGDQGRFDNDGSLYITGRIKEIINRGGEKIAPREVDEAFMDHPAVVQAVAFAVPHATLGEDVAAAVVLRPTGATAPDPTEKELREFAFSKLADYKVPSQVVIVDQIPKGPTGKLQRIGLAAKLETALRAEFVAPTDVLEKTLTELWSETLGIERIGIHDNFFSSGGDSLLAAHLFAHIKQRLTHQTLPLAVLFRAPTIAQLASVLRDTDWSSSWSSLVPIQPTGSKPPLFFVHAHGGNVVGYHNLARHLGPDQPFYGFQAQNLDGKQATARRIEDMAAHYIEEMTTVLPHGPCFLGGWCLGGIIALEMAQQLRAQGKEIALLAMVQSNHPGYPRFLPKTSGLQRLIRRLMTRIDFEGSSLVEIKPQERLSYGWKRAKRALTIAQVQVERVFTKLHLNIPHSRAYTLDMFERAHNMAYESYEPRPYQGPVALIRVSKQPLGIHPDPTLGWSELLKGSLELHEVPGYRSWLLQEPRVRILAEQLRACLDRAQSG